MPSALLCPLPPALCPVPSRVPQEFPDEDGWLVAGKCTHSSALGVMRTRALWKKRERERECEKHSGVLFPEPQRVCPQSASSPARRPRKVWTGVCRVDRKKNDLISNRPIRRRELVPKIPAPEGEWVAGLVTLGAQGDGTHQGCGTALTSAPTVPLSCRTEASRAVPPS